MAGASLVLDASAAVDLLIGAEPAPAVRTRLSDAVVHVPAHFDAEVLSALGRLERAALLSSDRVVDLLERTARMDAERHPVAPLLAGAWSRRGTLRLVDALYVELAGRIGCRVLTTDRRLATSTQLAEYVGPDR